MPEKVTILADNTYLSEIDRQTLSEDISDQQEILAQHPTVFLRPDDRTAPGRPLYIHEDDKGLSYLGLVVEHGSHEARKPPVHLEPRLKIRILSRQPKMISEITEEEFGGAYKSIHDQQSAVDWLERKYPGRKFSPSNIVTVYRIQYES